MRTFRQRLALIIAPWLRVERTVRINVLLDGRQIAKGVARHG